METESCHSNQSSYLTGTKNNFLLEANARNISSRLLVHGKTVRITGYPGELTGLTIPYLFRPDHLMIPEFRELSL